MHNEQWSASHGGVEVKGFVKYWLLISKYLAWPFIKLRISPNLISFLSVLVSIPLINQPNLWWLVVVALILDGIDGAVALGLNKASKLGALVDSICDRVVEFIWAIALYGIGLNFTQIFIFIGAAWLQEYLRARAGGLGFNEIGIVTISERPTRAIFIALALLITTYSGQILIAAIVVQIISLLMLARVINKSLAN
ncbi:MAG: hypothetical protein RL129_546 [Actinomycetota bacterium]|jgi:phosphatidylglycerophosphate synthase